MGVDLRMKPSKQDELIAYLTESLTTLNAIKSVVEDRNKTTRIRALKSMITIIHARLDASLKYAKAGGYTEFPLSLQQELYNPLIEYLAEEAV